MSSLYLVAVVIAVAMAVWLQRTVPLPKAYAWLSWGAAVVFAAVLAPTAWQQPGVEPIAQLVLLVVLPLIAVPYQVKMMRLIGRARTSGAASRAERGPGGGRVRNRGRRAR